MTDPRHWILDPGGHRQHMAIGAPKTGDDAGPFGTWIVLDDHLDPDEWICDLCNNLILTRWGTEPMPVPTAGSDALCGDCRTRIEEAEGRWPAQSCTCPPCSRTLIAWEPFIDHAYNLRARRSAAAGLN